MNLSSLECKGNNAAYVKRMMPDDVLRFLWLGKYYCAYQQTQ